MNEATQAWMGSSDEDMITAKVMLNGGRYLYVGFMCQLAVEKALKAVIANTGIFPPKIHGLATLATKSDIYEDMSQGYKDFLELLQPFHIEARYTEYKRSLSRDLNFKQCEDIMHKTKELISWINAKL